MSAPASPSSCPICSATNHAWVENWSDPVGLRNYSLWRCRNCDVVFADPFRFPGAEWYAKANDAAGYIAGTGGPDAGRFRFVLSHLGGTPGRLLDVGTASGRFLEMARTSGWNAEGLEIDGRMVEAARAAGLTVHQGVLDEDFALANASRYDAVTFFDVLEHLDDPARMLARAKRLLKPTGFLALSVPNNLRPTLFGRDAFDYPPHHLTRWTPDALRQFLERESWSLDAVDTGPLPAWEFSRVWADRSARALLRLYKSIRYGRGAANVPMSRLSDGNQPSAAVNKDRRLRLVYAYHSLFNVAAYPFFGSIAAYYRLRHPAIGVSLTVVARPR